MASIISHTAAGAALSVALAADGAPARYWPTAIAAAALPDADSLPMLLPLLPDTWPPGILSLRVLGSGRQFFLDASLLPERTSFLRPYPTPAVCQGIEKAMAHPNRKLVCA